MSQGNAIDLNIAFGGNQDLLAAHITTFWTMWESNRNLANDRWDEIYKYVSDKTNGVPYYARKLNGIEQTPTIQGNNKDKVFITY